jgi:tetratricopeptide (TPR) repeat protein
VSLRDLTAFGYLVQVGRRRHKFVTEGLWKSSLGSASRLDEADRLICESRPDPNHIDEILHVTSIALRLGDRDKVAEWLSQALLSAEAQRRHGDIERLICFPHPVPSHWSYSLARRRIAGLRSLLDQSWKDERLFRIAAQALRASDTAVGTKLLELVVAGKDDSEALAALLLLAGAAAKPVDHRAFAQYRESILRLSGGRGEATGALRSFEARLAYASGRLEEARMLAGQAARLLRGSNTLQKTLNLQLMAILESTKEPEKSVKTLEAALAATKEPELAAQIRNNVALLYTRMGKIAMATECADRGIHDLSGRISQARLASLRIKRAWCWADSDKIEMARREALALLSSPAVRFEPQRLIPVRLLVSFCDLYMGKLTHAMKQISRALDLVNRATADLRWDCLRFIVDTVIDHDAWDLVTALREDLFERPAGDDVLTLSSAKRLQALLLHRDGKLKEARRILEEGSTLARTLPFAFARARYLHQLGVVRLSDAMVSDEADAYRSAAGIFEEELLSYGTEGQAHYRVQALLRLACCASFDDQKQGLAISSRAVILARRIQSPWLLNRALELRHLIRTGAEPGLCSAIWGSDGLADPRHSS